MEMVSVVTVVLGGEIDTIANIYEDLRRNIPVVIIVDTGGIADFFQRWLCYTQDVCDDSEDSQVQCEVNEYDGVPRRVSNSSHTSSTSKGRMSIFQVRLEPPRTKLETMFKDYTRNLRDDLESILYKEHDDDLHRMKHQDASAMKNKADPVLEEVYRRVLYCLQPAVRGNITLFTPNPENDLSEALFQSIYQSYERALSSDNAPHDEDSVEGKTHFLQIAMEWNCIKAAKNYVLQNSLNNIAIPKVPFINALKGNLSAFVYEFIKLGIDLTEIFFPNEVFLSFPANRYETLIEYLYGDDMIKKEGSLLQTFIEEEEDLAHKRIDSTDALNIILRVLIGDYMHKLYFDSLNEECYHRLQAGLEKRSKESISNQGDKDLFLPNDAPEEFARDYILRDLFLWAILVDYIDTAKVFLAHMKYRICPALIATKILKKYHLKATHEDVKAGYHDSATYFENYAIECLRECVDQNADRACKIIVQENKLYGYVTCLQVAADAKDKLFIAQPSCVQTMNCIWYDKLYPELTRKRDGLALAIGLVSLGLLAPATVRFREVKSVQEGESLTKIVRSNGITYHDSYPLQYPRISHSTPAWNRYSSRLRNFHSSPLIKFCYHLIFYCFFLLLFSYFLLFNFSPPRNQSPSIHWTEILTIMLVSMMLIGEIHFFLLQDNLTFVGKIRNCLRDPFKPMTALAFILFYIGLILRFAYANSEEEFVVARVIMAFDIELWWLRSLSFIIVIPFLGPHLVAIWKMLKDLMFFICIIVIVMAGYGVASRSMALYPTVNNFTIDTGGPIDTRFDGRSVFRQIAYPVYYLLYGQLDNELGYLDGNPDAGWSISTHVLLAIHMMFVNILLTNLLIAMFSKRFDQVYEDTKNIWHSQQYIYTREYFARSPFLPPISFVYDVCHLLRFFFSIIKWKWFKRTKSFNVRVFRIIPKNESLVKKWRDFESASTFTYAHKEAKASKSSEIKLTSRFDVEDNRKEKDAVKKEVPLVETAADSKEVQERLNKLKISLEEVSALYKAKLARNNNSSKKDASTMTAAKDS